MSAIYSVVVCEEAVIIKSVSSGKKVSIDPQEVPASFLKEMIDQLRIKAKKVVAVAGKVVFPNNSEFIGWFAYASNRTKTV